MGADAHEPGTQAFGARVGNRQSHQASVEHANPGSQRHGDGSSHKALTLLSAIIAMAYCLTCNATA